MEHDKSFGMEEYLLTSLTLGIEKLLNFYNFPIKTFETCSTKHVKGGYKTYEKLVILSMP